MKNKIFKALTWVGGLFLLTLLLIDQNATAQNCPAPQSAVYSDKYYHANGANYGYVAPNNGYSGKRGNDRRHKQVRNQSRNNRNHNANLQSQPYRNLRVGSQLGALPFRAQRIVDRRGRVMYASHGLLWKEHVCPRNGRYFKAINWIR